MDLAHAGERHQVELLRRTTGSARRSTPARGARRQVVARVDRGAVAVADRDRRDRLRADDEHRVVEQPDADRDLARGRSGRDRAPAWPGRPARRHRGESRSWRRAPGPPPPSRSRPRRRHAARSGSRAAPCARESAGAAGDEPLEPRDPRVRRRQLVGVHQPEAEPEGATARSPHVALVEMTPVRPCPGSSLSAVPRRRGRRSPPAARGRRHRARRATARKPSQACVQAWST